MILADKYHGGVPTDHWHKFRDPQLAAMARAAHNGRVTMMGAWDLPQGTPSGTYVATLSYVGPPTYNGSNIGQGALDTGGTIWQWNGTEWVSDLSPIVAAVALGG